MFLLAQPLFFFFFFILSGLSEGMESEEHVVFPFSTEQCAASEGALSALDEREGFQSKESAHGGPRRSEPLTLDDKGKKDTGFLACTVVMKMHFLGKWPVWL